MPRLPRLLALGLSAALLATALACGLGGTVELTPREEYTERLGRLPDMYKEMDLPWHGGVIQKGSDRLLLVSYYRDPRPTPEQLKAWWPEALAAEGWSVERPSVAGSGALDAIVETPDGRRGTLTIAPDGTVWEVLITLNPAPDASP